MDQNVADEAGAIRLLRNPATSEAALSLRLREAGTDGVAWLESDPSRMWAWKGARGDETWSLGPLGDGDGVMVLAYEFSIHDANDADASVSIGQRWTEVNGHPYAIHHVAVDGEDYFYDRMVGVDLGDRIAYAMVPFKAQGGPHLFEAQYDKVLGVLALRTNGPLSCDAPIEPMRSPHVAPPP